MRKRTWGVVLLAAWCLTGCASGPSYQYVNYSFAAEGEETANMTFIAVRDSISLGSDDIFYGKATGVFFHDFEGKVVPPPPEGTLYLPGILFPAGRPLNITVTVRAKLMKAKTVVFECPPLEACDRNNPRDYYQLEYEHSLIHNRLVLTKIPRKVVYRQNL
jgi:hypothetical protein